MEKIVVFVRNGIVEKIHSNQEIELLVVDYDLVGDANTRITLGNNKTEECNLLFHTSENISDIRIVDQAGKAAEFD